MPEAGWKHYTGMAPSPQQRQTLPLLFDAHIWQPLADHQVHDTFPDEAGFTGGSQHSFPSPHDDAGTPSRSLTKSECGNGAVSNNWVNKVCRFPLTFV